MDAVRHTPTLQLLRSVRRSIAPTLYWDPNPACRVATDYMPVTMHAEIPHLCRRSQVAALMLEVQGIHARLATLSEFNYRMSEDDIRLSWRTMDYPTVRLLLL